MEHNISSFSFMQSHILDIDSEGINFRDTDAIKSRHFRFEEVFCVLMSANNTLSFQAGGEVFSIRTEPANPTHQAAIAALLEGLNNSTAPETDSLSKGDDAAG
jgi:hypothetical protein